MRPARLWLCVVLLAAGAVGCGLHVSKRQAVASPPSGLDFTAARSSEDNADIEITEAVLLGQDGSRQRPNCSGGNTLTCYVRKGSTERIEQQVASLAYG